MAVSRRFIFMAGLGLVPVVWYPPRAGGGAPSWKRAALDPPHRRRLARQPDPWPEPGPHALGELGWSA